MDPNPAQREVSNTAPRDALDAPHRDALDAPHRDAPDASQQNLPADPALQGGDDTEGYDAQTGTESTVASSTASLSESVREYRELHGRTFSQKIEYWGPNDSKQQDALDFKLVAQTLGLYFIGNKLTLAPIATNPGTVLDVGTGTGIWAIDFADTYPSAEVIGIDISPIQPSWVPANCKFQIDDFELRWTFKPDYFDFIHIRNLEAAVGNWKRLYTQAFKHAKPGGYIKVKQMDIEFHSQTVNVTDDHIFKRWYKAMTDATDKMGKTLRNVDNHGIANGLSEAGFVVEAEKVWKIPIGGWCKDAELKKLGTCTLQYLDESLEAFALFLLKEVMGWEYVDLMVFVSEMRKAIHDPRNQTFYHLHLVYARKPEEKGEAAV